MKQSRKRNAGKSRKRVVGKTTKRIPNKRTSSKRTSNKITSSKRTKKISKGGGRGWRKLIPGRPKDRKGRHQLPEEANTIEITEKEALIKLEQLLTRLHTESKMHVFFKGEGIYREPGTVGQYDKTYYKMTPNNIINSYEKISKFDPEIRNNIVSHIKHLIGNHINFFEQSRDFNVFESVKKMLEEVDSDGISTLIGIYNIKKKEVFDILLRHLCLVLKNSRTNLMKSEDLARSITPSIFHNIMSEDPLQSARQTEELNKLFANYLENYCRLLDSDDVAAGHNVNLSKPPPGANSGPSYTNVANSGPSSSTKRNLAVFDFDCTLSQYHLWHINVAIQKLHSRNYTRDEHLEKFNKDNYNSSGIIDLNRMLSNIETFYKNIFGGMERINRIRFMLKYLKALSYEVVIATNNYKNVVEDALLMAGINIKVLYARDYTHRFRTKIDWLKSKQNEYSNIIFVDDSVPNDDVFIGTNITNLYNKIKLLGFKKDGNGLDHFMMSKIEHLSLQYVAQGDSTTPPPRPFKKCELYEKNNCPTDRCKWEKNQCQSKWRDNPNLDLDSPPPPRPFKKCILYEENNCPEDRCEWKDNECQQKLIENSFANPGYGFYNSGNSVVGGSKKLKSKRNKRKNKMNSKRKNRKRKSNKSRKNNQKGGSCKGEFVVVPGISIPAASDSALGAGLNIEQQMAYINKPTCPDPVPHARIS